MSDDLAGQGGKIADTISKIAERVSARLVAEVSLAIVTEARRLAPRDSGVLANSISAVQVDPMNWDVGTNVEYAPYQEFGTKPHKGTKHPGNKAQPFLMPAINKVIEEVPDKAKAIFAEEQGK